MNSRQCCTPAHLFQLLFYLLCSGGRWYGLHPWALMGCCQSTNLPSTSLTGAAVAQVLRDSGAAGAIIFLHTCGKCWYITLVFLIFTSTQQPTIPNTNRRRGGGVLRDSGPAGAVVRHPPLPGRAAHPPPRRLPRPPACPGFFIIIILYTCYSYPLITRLNLSMRHANDVCGDVCHWLHGCTLSIVHQRHAQ